MLRLLSGTLNIKHTIKTRVNAHFLASIKILVLVYAIRQKEMDNGNLWLVRVIVSDSCLWLSDMST